MYARIFADSNLYSCNKNKLHISLQRYRSFLKELNCLDQRINKWLDTISWTTDENGFVYTGSREHEVTIDILGNKL